MRPASTAKRVITDKGKKGDANDAVIGALTEAGMLISRGRLKHQYPHSWRSKKPIIFRNTPQWFISMSSHGLRDMALEGHRRHQFFPAAGQNRLRGMIEQRPDWVISRQRAWGVPIAVFVNKETGEILNDTKVNAAHRRGLHGRRRRRLVCRWRGPALPRARLQFPGMGTGARHSRRLVRFRLHPCLLPGAAARPEMAGRPLSRRLRPASRLVPFLAARILRHARPRTL